MSTDYPVYPYYGTAGGKLQDQVAIITGGDSGIGRAVAVAFAKEGADVVIAYLDEHEDAAELPQERFAEITPAQLENTYRTNIRSFFHMTRAALPHLDPGGRIINTTSRTAFEGAADRIDYSSTKGAIVGFTRSLALQLVARGIRVNAVAPGPVWTPLTVDSGDVTGQVLHVNGGDYLGG